MIQVWAKLCAALSRIIISILRMCQVPHTSSRDKACLNTLIVVLSFTKGKVLPETIPTLATVSLSINRTSIKARVVRCHEHPPDTEKVDGYGAAEHLLVILRVSIAT